MSSVKKNIRSAVCAMLSLLLMLTMISFPANVSALGLNYTSLTLTKGYSTTLKVNDADGKSISWSSSDSAVASVSGTGKVVGKSAGSATITADVGGTKLTCKITVVGGKLALSTKDVTVKEGEYKYVTVRAKGSHALKAVSGDKSIVTCSWITPWNNDDIRLKLTAKGSGSTTVKIVMSKYPEIYTTIKVKVENDKAVLLTGQSSVTTKLDSSASLMIYSDKDNALNYSFSDNTVAKVSEGTWKNHYCTLTITGLKAGSTNLTISRKDNASVKQVVTVTVTSSGYYTVTTTIPSKTLANDIVKQWTDSKTYQTKYMLLPYNYDVAQANTAVSKDSGVYEYYQVYAEAPSKKASTDSAKSFSATVDGQTVTRYVLVPSKIDNPSLNTAVASYTKKFEYWTVYNVSPENYKYLYTDVVKSWAATVDYKAVTRYILLSLNYDASKLQTIIDQDTGSSSGGYYAVSTVQPTFIAPTDQVVTFPATVNNQNVTCYILVPANYDEARVNDAMAAFTGVYDYWKVYTVKPQQRLAYDVIQSWTKNIDNKLVTRYMLLPTGYDDALFQQYKNRDIGSNTTGYYAVTTNYPTKIADNDIIWYWFNETQNVGKYMLLPANYDIVKRNELVYKDTGVFDYYTIYSTTPTKKASTDEILTLNYQGGVVNMLVPQNWDNDKVNQGLMGLRVY
ncbi:MAG: Ig-like domain-containing protein [Ruminococcus sp.]|nr:Ig-like domain-containing protein [Ruminococcus sp.]